MNRQAIAAILCMVLLALVTGVPGASAERVEKRILQHLASERTLDTRTDCRCRRHDTYVVYLIDNFEQPVHLTPEVTTSHGELLYQMLISGREDIRVKPLNTSLSRGLAMVIDDLLQGGCADAVISSIPGSNYTYHQIGSMLPGDVAIGRNNILDYQAELIDLLKGIAHAGFPSVEWLQQIDVNSAKLANDARKVTFAEALGRLKVPILIPYGNADVDYGNMARTVNILSLVSHIRAFSALDEEGRRIPGYPYGPLSVGDARAIYHVREIPDPENPFLAHLDVNDDDAVDYTFRRMGRIAYRDPTGRLAFAPPVLSDAGFEDLKAAMARHGTLNRQDGVVLTADHYRELRKLGLAAWDVPRQSTYVWVHSPHGSAPFPFDAAVWTRGRICGTSLIPPNKVKDLLSMNR